MFRELCLLAIASATIVSCSNTPNATSGSPDAGVTPPIEATKASLRFKRNERIREDFSQALALAPDELCNELGAYSCTDTVHTIALGGVEPYVLGVREPLEETTSTAPIAVDRVALSGCTKRVARDLADPQSAVIFRASLGDAGARREAIVRLYERALQRSPSESELAHLEELYDAAAGDWAVLSCYAVLTSVEALFY